MVLLRGVVLTLAAFVLFSCASLSENKIGYTATAAAEIVKMPDFEKAPYKLVAKDMLVSFFYYHKGPSVVRQYYSRTDMAVSGNYIIVFMNSDGSYEYAEWLNVDKEKGGIFTGIMRGFKYENGKFVFENEEEWRTGKVKSDKIKAPPEEEIIS